MDFRSDQTKYGTNVKKKQIKPKIDASNYQWNDLTGSLLSLLKAVTDAGGVSEEILGWEEKELLIKPLTKEWDYYGNGMLDWIHDCAILKDGSILVNLTTTQFDGTDAPSKKNVQWWLGRPK